MIYESSRTAKKFREQEAAERKNGSQSHLGNRKSSSESPTTIDNNECTNTDVQGVAPKQGIRQFHQNIQLEMDLNRMQDDHQHHYQHHPTPATESLLQNNWQQMLKSRMNGECTTGNNERTNTVVQGGEPRQGGRRQIKEQYPDGTLHITDPGRSGAGENRMHHHQHHPQPVGPSPQPQYQYPAGYHLQTYVQPFQHQHQQYLYVTTYAVPPGYTVLQPPVPDSLEPKNTNGDGSAASSANGVVTGAASSSNTKLKRKKKSSPSSATAKRPRRSPCSHKDCTNNAVSGGVCTRHGACIYHGAKGTKICSYERCTNLVVKGGVCKRHGAKVKIKTCSHEGCSKNAQRGGVCCRHEAK